MRPEPAVFPNGSMCRNPLYLNGCLYNVFYLHRHFGQKKFNLWAIYDFVLGCYITAFKYGQVESESPLNRLHGVTVCTIENQNRKAMGVGFAFCSVKDNFCKKIGREGMDGKPGSRDRAIANLQTSL